MLLSCRARCVFRASGFAASGQTGLMAVRTVGHGTLTRAAFVDLLTGAGIAAVVDVRRHPGSRRHPHFNVDHMRRWLPAAGVAYRWEERLGGRRRRLPDSPNGGLRNAGFQGYADHMARPVFWEALDEVLREAQERPTAVLCSESVWWRCHRRLIGDAVVLVRSVEVQHLLHDGRLVAHQVTDVARRADDTVVYDRLVQGELGLP